MNQEGRAKTVEEIVHEIANAVSIVQANLEGMIDGVLEPNRERLEALHQTLSGIAVALERWRREQQ